MSMTKSEYIIIHLYWRLSGFLGAKLDPRALEAQLLLLIYRQCLWDDTRIQACHSQPGLYNPFDQKELERCPQRPGFTLRKAGPTSENGPITMAGWDGPCPPEIYFSEYNPIRFYGMAIPTRATLFRYPQFVRWGMRIDLDGQTMSEREYHVFLATHAYNVTGELRSIPPPDYQDTIKPNAPPSMRNRFASSDLSFPEAPRSTLSTPTPAPARNDDESRPSSSGVQLAAPSPARPIVFEGFTPKPIPSWPQQPVPTARNPTPRTQMLSANGQWHQAQNPPYRPSPLSRTSVVPEDLDVDTPNTLVQPSSRPSTAVATPFYQPGSRPNSAYSSPVKPINHPVSHVSPPPPPPIYRGDIPTARNVAFPGGDVPSSLQYQPHATTTVTHPHAIPSSQLIPNPAAVAPVPHGYHSLPNRPVMHHPHLPPNAGSICENPIDVDELYIPDPRGCVSPPLSACASPEPVPGIVPLDPAEAAIFSFLDDYPLYADVSPPLSAVGSPELEESVTKGKGKGKAKAKEKATATTTATTATASTTKAKKATTTTRKKRVSEPADDAKKAKKPNLKRGNDAMEADGSVTATATASRKRAKRS